jgi:hypothetical protein
MQLTALTNAVFPSFKVFSLHTLIQDNRRQVTKKEDKRDKPCKLHFWHSFKIWITKPRKSRCVASKQTRLCPTSLSSPHRGYIHECITEICLLEERFSTTRNYTIAATSPKSFATIKAESIRPSILRSLLEERGIYGAHMMPQNHGMKVEAQTR